MPMPPTDAVKGVIFDLDGTLVDSRLDFEQMRKDMGAPSGVPIIEYIDEHECGIERQRLWDVVEYHEIKGAEAATWIPNAEQTLQLLHGRGMPTAILTRNCRAATELTLQRLGISIDNVVTREDHPAKPNPEGLLHIAEHWGIAPTALVYVGDYLFDLQAAANAGMRGCLYQPGESQPFAHLADWVIACFSELPNLVYSS